MSLMYELINHAKAQSETISIGLKSGITFTGKIKENPKLLYTMEFITIHESFDNDFETAHIPISEIEYISYPEGDEIDE